MNIGKGIKFIRVAADLRQGEMAKSLDISQNYLSLLENNKAEPSMGLVKKISELFGVPASYILWEESMPTVGATEEITAKYTRIRELVRELQQLRITQKAHGELG